MELITVVDAIELFVFTFDNARFPPFLANVNR